MTVRYNPNKPHLLFIYDCEGQLGAAYAQVREILDIPKVSADPRAKEYAAKIWSETEPAPGTVVERYLCSRGIKLPVPPALRFHPVLKHSTGGFWPAMVGGIFAADGELCAIHRTFLRSSGSGKAPVEPDKMTLGPIGGLAVQLAPVAERLAIAEGIETALSYTQLRHIPAWSASSAVGVRTIRLPPQVRHVVIVADGDEAGRSSARAAMKKFLREGRTAVIAQAPDGMDFNDVLMAGAKR